ncbi:c6 finger domain-containing [Pyrenophora seminiperda CCB06]|uniref:C6 finger domain-containing n=1 Tax=Pyrenophora seminiperda CCB06 TaxID=1302712 RepID=A0A3M7MHP8_9PLEO|nr:c6 finger domain-containing [Pyrenophora seminiperda CCB06]
MTESWQDLVVWDEELYDPFFQGATSYPRAQQSSYTSSYQFSDSYTSEPSYLVSAPLSVADEPPSLEYSVPPSIPDERCSSGQGYGTSLSFDTTTTSPSPFPDGSQYFGSFGTYDNVLLSPLRNFDDPPILDTRYDRIPETIPSSTGSLESAAETVFNPHVTGSSHSFSGLDVRASRVFSNLGHWADRPRIIEPIDENVAEVAPITIPRTFSQSYDPANELHSRSRAITIPAGVPTSYNNRASHSASTRRVPPILSVSPGASRQSRNAMSPRHTSRPRRKTSTPSPASESYAWVAYQRNPLTNKLAPTSIEGMVGRALRGRKKALTAEQRSHAALMRIVRACSNCQRRKEKCDPGTPCKACVEHYKGDLVNHPCRDHTLSDLSAAFLSDRLGWHPTDRPLESFIPAGEFEISTDCTYTVPLNFGFGPSFPVSVHAVKVKDNRRLVHEHIIYAWPPEVPTGPAHKHAVLPAVLTNDAQFHLIQTLDSHLSLLVARHFRAFPLFRSPLRVLREIYVFSCSIPTNSKHYRILHQALKLLVLVHIGGDITLPSPTDSSVVRQFVCNNMDIPEHVTPTPCFIRAQFGRIMPDLAFKLMREVLSSLEQLCLNKDSDDWPIVLAVLISVLMTVESVHYHAAKLPYHNRYDIPRSNAEQDAIFDEQGVKTLLDFYSACFSGCHARIRPDWEGEPTQSLNIGSPEAIFIGGLRGTIKMADDAGYLGRKANETREGDDMGYFFDRLVARLLISRS